MDQPLSQDEQNGLDHGEPGLGLSGVEGIQYAGKIDLSNVASNTKE